MSLRAGAAVALMLLAAPARAQETCASAYEGAQERRRAGELTRALADLRLCERACPKKLAGDCETWRGEVEAQLASVALTAIDAAGKPLTRARVLLDGAPIAEAITAEPIVIDPGKHALAIDDGAGGRAEAEITLAPGEKGRALTLRFAPRAPRAPVAPPPPPPRAHSAVPWVLGILGLGGLGAGAVLGIKGQVEKAALEKRCAPNCDKAIDVDPIAREWWAGAAAAIAGGVTFGAATAVWFWEERSAKAPPQVRVVVGPAWAGIAGAF
jgi:hypothetical protein